MNFIREVSKYFRLTLSLCKLAILTELEFRISFIVKVVGMILNDASFLILWYIYFDRFPVLNGWSLRESILLLAVSTLAYGWVLFLGRGLVYLARNINRGELDFFLSFPVEPLWFLAVSRTDVAALGDVIFGIALLFLVPDLNLGSILLFGALSILAGVIFIGFLIITQSLAFFFTNFEDSAEQLWWTLLGFTLYPGSIYSGGLKVVIYTIFPAFFMALLPVHILTDFAWGDLALMFLFATVLLILALKVFSTGLRRYESGNLIANRI